MRGLILLPLILFCGCEKESPHPMTGSQYEQTGARECPLLTKENFLRVQPGMYEADVVLLLGKPTSTEYTGDMTKKQTLNGHVWRYNWDDVSGKRGIVRFAATDDHNLVVVNKWQEGL